MTPLLTWIFSIITAIMLFLHGLASFSEEVARIGGDSLRTRLHKLTHTDLYGALTGAISTALVQSSSAVTSMAVGLAHNRTLTDRGAFAVMIGADVGTTLTASTALLASTALDTVPRKLALLNTSFNVLGVLLFTTLLQPIIGMILTMNIVVASRFPLFTPHLIWQPLLSHSSFCRISGQHWTAGSIGSPEVASLKQNVCITINLKPESR